MLNQNTILKRNEAEANKITERIFHVMIALFAIIYILNLVGIFIVSHTTMTIAFVGGSLMLILPSILNRRFDPSSPWLKYVYIVIANIFLIIIQITLSFHSYVIFVLPIALSCVYFSKKSTLYAFIMTLVVTAVGQLLSYHFAFIPDENFLNIKRLVLFSIVPKLLCLSSLGYMIYFISKRTTKMLQNQIRDAEKIIDLHKDMIFGFANLVENRDENTGGHVKRASRYVELLARALRERGIYKEQLTDEYINNLANAAPMHDIGKISTPDNILQKPGKLTEEEFEIVKRHSENGGRIVRQTFSHVGDEAYRKVVYEVARYHHEKWSGCGYPEGREKTEIPLSARIMSIADVFDAISQKRCYRDALPLEECFEILEKGSGTDFEPVLVETFLSLKEEVKKIIVEIEN